MPITHIEVVNWQNFPRMSVDVSRRMFVVGANATGKSNLLDVFRFLSDIARRGGGLAVALASRGGMSNIRNVNARNRKHGAVEIRIQLRDGDEIWEYSLGLKQENNGHRRTLITHERVLRGEEVLLNRPDCDDKEDSELKTQTHMEQMAANKKFRPLASYLAGISYYHLSPQALRESQQYSGTEDPFGRGLLAEMNSMSIRTRQAWLNRIQEALTSAVPGFKSLKLEVDKAGNPHLIAGYSNWRRSDTRQKETEFSDGTLRLIGLLWTILSKSGSSTVLLEEPELSLNAGIVRVLPTMFARAQRSNNLQLFMTTHAPDLLDDEGVSPYGVVVLTLDSEGTVGRVLGDIEEVEPLIDAGIPLSEAVDGLINPKDFSPLLKAIG